MATTGNSRIDLEAYEAYTTEVRGARAAVRSERDAQIAALYPNARTFVLRRADPVGTGEAAAAAVAAVPRTLTLVTPDLADPSGDHLYLGGLPVLSRDLRWDAAFEELGFATSDGERTVSGSLRLTHSRLRAFGTIDVGGRTVGVEYHVDPQRYRMKVAKDAAYLAGQGAVITWDTNSARWKNADWGKGYELGFTYGVNGEEVIGDEKVYTFVAGFDDIATGRRWEPLPLTYGGYITRDLRLAYGLMAGERTPTGSGAALFPYQLTVKLSEFAADFAGGMVVGEPGLKGAVYGIVGDWAGHGIAGLYHLHGAGARDDAAQPARVVAVHDRTLHVDGQAVATEADGDVLSWHGLSEAAAAAAGIPVSGSLTFSPDGAHVVGSSFGMVGTRVHPDEALALVDRLGEAHLAGVLRGVDRLRATEDPDHKLPALLAMSQFARNEKDEYYDRIQAESMDDFYVILQNYMDPDLRSTFFHPEPPPLNAELRAIAAVKGTKGTEPHSWFKSLSVPYTATCLGKFSDDPWAKTLNTIRSEQWMSQTTGASDVMAAQSPLLYARRYRAKHKNLEWFLTDQAVNAAAYAPEIDKKTEEWLDTARTNNPGDDKQLAEMEKTIRALGEHAKTHKQYWAFAVYTSTTLPSYLNMLQVILASGVDIDGSEFGQRVQRTVAILNVLDTSSFFSQEYAHLLQLFELQSILPQMVDLNGDVKNFHFAVDAILKAFIDQHLNRPDDALKDAARELQKRMSETLAAELLAIIRTCAAVGAGLFAWGFVVERFQTTVAKVFSSLPKVVVGLFALGFMSTLIALLASGSLDWNLLPADKKAFVVISGVGMLTSVALGFVKRGVALHAVWKPDKTLRNLGMFFSPKLLKKAGDQVTSVCAAYLLQESGPKVKAALNPKEWWANRAQAAANAGPPKQTSFGRRVFGKNLSRFMATRLAAALSIVGIVMSSIDLARGGDSMEKATNAMFLIACVLELIAVVGAWALGTSALAIGGMLVSSMFSFVAVLGFLALVAGAILLIVMLARPQPSPVQKFAQDRAGQLYMPYKAAIETFRLYQPLGEPQRAGIAVFTGLAPQRSAMRIASDGKVSRGEFDSTGHTAFYLTTDELGRTQLGAPILDAAGKAALMSLGVDAGGAVVASDYDRETPTPEPKQMWYTDMVGDGSYEETSHGVKELKSAPFVLKSAYFADDKKTTRYLALDGATGWRTTELRSEAAEVRLEMVPIKPAELSVTDVEWVTVAHDEVTGPALLVPGSAPWKWTISPALPDGLEFDQEAGTIAMKKGHDVPPAPRREYTLRVQNALGNVETTFELEVKVPTTEPAAVFEG